MAVSQRIAVLSNEPVTNFRPSELKATLVTQEVCPDWITGSTFDVARVVSHGNLGGGPESFTVQRRNGAIEEYGVVHLLSLPHTPQHNAWVERGNRDLKEESGTIFGDFYLVEALLRYKTLTAKE